MNKKFPTPPAAWNLRKTLASGRFLGVFLLLVGLLALVLLPYMQSGFYADDCINSAFRGQMKVWDASLWKSILGLHNLWMSKGRYFPLGLAATYTYWYIVGSSLPAAKFVQICLILIDIAFYARFIVRITGSSSAALASVVMLPLFFQVRASPDAMTSFCPLLQASLLFAIVSADSFLVAMEVSSVTRLILAWGFFACGLATYEIGLSVVPMAVVLAISTWRRSPRIAIWGLGGYSLLSAAYLGINFYLKAHATNLYSGTSLRLGAECVKTFFIQVFATFPLTYYAFDPHAIYQKCLWPDMDTLAVASVIVIATTVLVWHALLRAGPLRDRGWLSLAVGGVMLLTPPIFIAISERYQQELRWGIGYLPVYLQFFGLTGVVSTIACAAFASMAKPAGRLTKAAAALLGLTIGMGNAGAFLINGITVESENIIWQYPRTLIEQAIHKGLLDHVPTGSTIVRDTPNMFDLAPFYVEQTGRSLKFSLMTDLLAAEPDTFFGSYDCSKQSIYELRYAAAASRHGNGWALVARVQGITFRKSGNQITLLDRTLTEPVGFKREPDLYGVQATSLTEAGLETHDAVPGLLRRVDRWTVPMRVDKRSSLVEFLPGTYRGIYSSPPSELGVPPSARRPFLMLPAGSGDLPAADGGNLQTAALEEANAAPSRVMSVGFGCELTAEGIAFPYEINAHLELRAAHPGGGFSLAFRVWPDVPQRTGVSIISNHRSDFRGFTLENVSTGDPEQFSFIVGDGKMWHPLGDIRLQPGRWNLVVISFSPASSEITVVNDAISSCRAPVSPADVDDNLIYVGNWLNGDRPFNGQMKDFIWHPRPFTSDEMKVMLRSDLALLKEPAPL